MVEQLLEFAAVEAGRVEVAPTSVALDAEVESVLADLAPLLGARFVERDIPAVTVTVDGTLLRPTLANLISNAAKYTPSRGRPWSCEPDRTGTPSASQWWTTDRA